LDKEGYGTQKPEPQKKGGPKHPPNQRLSERIGDHLLAGESQRLQKEHVLPHREAKGSLGKGDG